MSSPQVSADSNAWFDHAFSAAPLMLILRGLGVERSVELSERAWDLGIDMVEIPLQSDTDAEALRTLAPRAAERGLCVGAGTILDPEGVRLAAECGAAFTVAPGTSREVLEASVDLGIPHLPGVATATEIHAALRHGVRWVKGFPAARLGASWFRDMRGPFPEVRFVATGGMSAHNAAEFLDAGVSVVAVGSAIEDEAQIPALAELLAGR
ncbi:bifunctional 4-hydroxy-2-oxoglutarate aldolase/2-dehydro-3-deoxy-phosphogluconate aldolase [Microbacterium sp. bgisy203]|uniref:bifunctional 4-hydroxy-2-oxoglutarate aldolase/2-dehydro-3-deoxy-phosphogluconate aldolase n=1 Tax=Microbacterium sp. bgisy203 TaxID=3413799 RepID=UPI003D747377